MQSLEPRPSKGRQQEVVQEKRCADAQIDIIEHRQPSIQQKDQVKEQEGHAELNKDLGWNITEQFSAKKDSSAPHIEINET